MNRKIPFMAALLAVLAFGLDGAAFPEEPVPPAWQLAKLQKRPQRAAKQGQRTG